MEKIKFTVQILVLVLAFPVWFVSEITMTDKTMRSVEINNSDSSRAKKTAVIKNENAERDIDPKTAGFGMQIVVCN